MRLSNIIETLQPTNVPATWFVVGSRGWERLPPDVNRFEQTQEYQAVFEDEGQQYLVSFVPRKHNDINIVFTSFHPTKNEGGIPPNMQRTGRGRPFTILSAVSSIVLRFIAGADPEAIGYMPADSGLARVYNVITRRLPHGYVRAPISPPDVVFVRADIDPQHVGTDYPTGGISH